MCWNELITQKSNYGGKGRRQRPRQDTDRGGNLGARQSADSQLIQERLLTARRH